MKIYCSGIGGIGLSAYASLQRASGHTVLGSDRALSDLTNELEKQGISVFQNQDGTHVPDDIDLFVYSEAIPPNAPERKRAKELGIRELSYFAALGEFSRDHRVIAVCGTHGKSSTTAMLAKALTDAGLDPSVVVGTKVPDLDNKNWRKGNSDLFVIEACEYRGSFLHLHPNIILMTTVDGDHFDAFPTQESYRDVFLQFIKKLPSDGVLITHGKDPDCAAIMKECTCTMIDADNRPLPELSVPGVHMQENARLVAACAEHLGIDVSGSLKTFSGTWRRMEHKGETKDGVTVIDDYAHHPREIAATIAAMRGAYPGRRIVCLFQPHMHERTKRLYHEFIAAFDGADLVVTTDTYDARPDSDSDPVDMESFTHDMQTEAVYGGSLASARALLTSRILKPQDVLLVLGAGDVTSVASELVC